MIRYIIGITNVDLPNERTTPMSADPTFTPRLLGETEKTLNAILDRHLSGAGLSEQHWITLTLAVASDGPIDRTELVQKVTKGAKFREDDVEARVSELIAMHLFDDSGSPEVVVTDAGRELHAQIRRANAELTERLWGDLAPEELATAARVLTTVLERANGEFAQL
jgi:DNA-binding MarR family transcriptional regulator